MSIDLHVPTTSLFDRAQSLTDRFAAKSADQAGSPLGQVSDRANTAPIDLSGVDEVIAKVGDLFGLRGLTASSLSVHSESLSVIEAIDGPGDHDQLFAGSRSSLLIEGVVTDDQGNRYQLSFSYTREVLVARHGAGALDVGPDREPGPRPDFGVSSPASPLLGFIEQLRVQTRDALMHLRNLNLSLISPTEADRARSAVAYGNAASSEIPDTPGIDFFG